MINLLLKVIVVNLFGIFSPIIKETCLLSVVLLPTSPWTLRPNKGVDVSAALLFVLKYLNQPIYLTLEVISADAFSCH